MFYIDHLMIWTDLIKVHIFDLSCSVNDHVRSRSTQINNIKTYVCSSILRFLWSVLYIIVCHFVLFLLLVIDLYVLLWFTDLCNVKSVYWISIKCDFVEFCYSESRYMQILAVHSHLGSANLAIIILKTMNHSAKL